MTLRKQFLDQPLHALTGTAIVLPVLLWPGIASTTWAFFGIAAVREITEEGNPVTLEKVVRGLTHSKLDLACWTASGALLGLLLEWLGVLG